MPEQETGKGRRRRRIVATAAALALALVGGILVIVAVNGQQSPPELATANSAPPTGTAPSTRGDSPEAGRSGSGEQPLTMAPSKPVAIDIPAIDVHSPMLELGLREDDSLEVPPHEPQSKTGWFQGSPTPGELGPSVILGHIDSDEYGPAVFYELTKLTPGNKVTVDRADGSTAVFRIEDTVRYAKDDFPTLEVYGNIDHAGIRLITCGGEFDLEEGGYEENIVSYGTLIASRPTS